jgi:hypothetical protein
MPGNLLKFPHEDIRGNMGSPLTDLFLAPCHALSVIICIFPSGMYLGHREVWTCPTPASGITSASMPPPYFRWNGIRHRNRHGRRFCLHRSWSSQPAHISQQHSHDPFHTEYFLAGVVTAELLDSHFPQVRPRCAIRVSRSLRISLQVQPDALSLANVNLDVQNPLVAAAGPATECSCIFWLLSPLRALGCQPFRPENSGTWLSLLARCTFPSECGTSSNSRLDV